MTERDIEMADTVLTPDASDAPIDQQAWNTFLQTMELRGVNVVALTAERVRGGDAEGAQFEIQAGYHFDAAENLLQYRFDATANIGTLGEEPMGRVTCGVVVSLYVPELPADDLIVAFGQNSAPRMAHPFLREVVASTAQRIDFPGLFIPAILFQSNPDPNVPAGSYANPDATPDDESVTAIEARPGAAAANPGDA